LKGLRACKLRARKQWLLDGLYTVDSGDAAMRALMAAEVRPTAVITVNDMTALGAMRAAHELGFLVPGDVSIIGLDDIELTRVISPALTTIQLPRRELAQACVECFAHMLKHPKKPGLQRILESRLVVRRSTGPVKR
jgi:DNA-binding LacI/PurR family transcriptional regulator